MQDSIVPYMEAFDVSNVVLAIFLIVDDKSRGFVGPVFDTLHGISVMEFNRMFELAKNLVLESPERDAKGCSGRLVSW
jgi:hypothetical protein